nr:hypothetical protein [Bacteroidaceae bacterium]
PGLGTMRFGLRAKSVDDVNKVKTGLITTRRIIFTPSTELKEELAGTSVQITCYDRNGNEVKRVTSADDGEVEDNEGLTPDPSHVGEGSQNGGSNSGTENGGSQNGGTNTGNQGGGTGTIDTGGGNTGGNGGSTDPDDGDEG